MNVFERNHAKLNKILGGKLVGLPVGTHIRMEAGKAMMRLGIEKNEPDKISITHYFEQNGDLVSDPDILVRVDDTASPPFIEVLTYQDTLGYQQVYPEPGKVYPRRKRELNAFLAQWLKNIIQQGYKEAQ